MAYALTCAAIVHWFRRERQAIEQRAEEVIMLSREQGFPFWFALENPAEAKACFHKALEIAHRQQAESLELRAAMSLGRLWQQHGKLDEARRLLAEIYNWFTEGFDTADLRDAKALLDALS